MLMLFILFLYNCYVLTCLLYEKWVNVVFDFVPTHLFVSLYCAKNRKLLVGNFHCELMVLLQHRIGSRLVRFGLDARSYLQDSSS